MTTNTATKQTEMQIDNIGAMVISQRTFRLADGIDIVSFDSSSQEKRYRVELADGRHFQINERLATLLQILQAPATVTELAGAFYAQTAERVQIEQLDGLCEQLLEQGLIHVDGQPVEPTKPATPKAYLGMHFRRTILRTEWLAPLARLFQGLFYWRVAAPAIALIVVSHIFAYHALSTQPEIKFELFTGPLLTGLLLFSILLHELGHVAACHRWQCPHGPLGFGLYFSMPIFYVDVTQAWRLSRRQRAAVDLGGVYLQSLCVPLALLLYWWTGNMTYLTFIILIDMLVLYNFEPIMKLDGYWLLSDLTGVPNLHSRTQEAALQAGQRLWRWLTGKVVMQVGSPFDQWSLKIRAIIWIYMVVSAVVWPLFMIYWIPTLWQALRAYPGLVQDAAQTLITAAAQGDGLTVLAQLSGLIMPSLILLGLSFELKRLGGQLVTAIRKRRTKRASLHTAPAGAI